MFCLQNVKLNPYPLRRTDRDRRYFLTNGGFDESHNQPQKTLSLLILCDCDKQRIAMDSVPEVNGFLGAE